MIILVEFVDLLTALAIFIGLVMGMTAAYKWFYRNYLNKDKYYG